jgi:uncharacterized membrane protein
LTDALAKGVSQITTGFYTIAIAATVLGIVAVIIGSKVGGKNRRQRKATADLVWAIGLVLLASLLVPKLFSGGT